MKDRYHYTGCGLDWVYLVNGYKRHDTPYGGGVSVEDADGLHELIAHEIILHPAKIRGQEFRFLRSMLGLSQAGLGEVLGVSRATVARWEGGPNDAIDPPADRALRMFYAGKILGNAEVKKIINMLTEIDALQHDKQSFKERNGEWELAKAA